MTLTNIPVDLQNLLVLDYEYQVKTILMVGWFIFSLFYLFYWYKRQTPTKLFLLGTFRFVIYVSSWMWVWLFWLLYPVYIHPNVPIDNLLLFLFYSYTGLTTIFFVIFMFNFTVWIPRLVVRAAKIDIEGFEGEAFRTYFGNQSKNKLWKQK